MNCHTQPGGNHRCEGTATQMLIFSLSGSGTMPSIEPRQLAPVCKPCGREFILRDTYAAVLVPLHVHEPLPAFLIVEGHRLVDDPEHGAKCYDCGRTGTEDTFKSLPLYGCRARPESIDHLRLAGDIVWADRNQRATKAARLWLQAAADDLGMAVGDWRSLHNPPSTCATFTFRDREYRLKFDMGGYRIFAEKLDNRGRPEPELLNPESRELYKRVTFTFHNRVTDAGSMYFATYTLGSEDVILHAPKGQIRAVLRLQGLGDTREHTLTVVTDAVCDTFGSISTVTFRA